VVSDTSLAITDPGSHAYHYTEAQMERLGTSIKYPHAKGWCLLDAFRRKLESEQSMPRAILAIPALEEHELLPEQIVDPPCSFYTNVIRKLGDMSACIGPMGRTAGIWSIWGYGEPSH
jgi:hypothetical protein